jgi:hypothetical protein
VRPRASRHANGVKAPAKRRSRDGRRKVSSVFADGRRETQAYARARWGEALTNTAPVGFSDPVRGRRECERGLPGAGDRAEDAVPLAGRSRRTSPRPLRRNAVGEQRRELAEDLGVPGCVSAPAGRGVRHVNPTAPRTTSTSRPTLNGFSSTSRGPKLGRVARELLGSIRSDSRISGIAES